MSKWIVDIHGDIEGDYELIEKYKEPKTGHWIFVDEAKEHARCSECNSGIVDLFDGKLHNYCEVCGAKMDWG